jgi:hypothetical protein
LKVEIVGYNVSGHKIIKKGTLWDLGSKIFYILFKPKVVGKHGKKEIWKGPKKITFKETRYAKKDIMGAKNINISICEN